VSREHRWPDNGSLELFSGGAIGFEGKRFAARGFNFPYKLKSFLFRTGIGKRHGCAVRRKSPDDTCSDTF
jgi:hypothetical protein